jgi:2-dehydro-3-deoxyglucarate aldolase/4-hydroxy-2-oxoheptanedioate aldolase
MNNADLFRERIRSGKICVGMAITFSDPAVSELVAEAGYDFTWIDMEHAPLDLPATLGHVMALRGTETAPFVRVRSNDANVIKPVLDLAPAAIIIPAVNSADEARAGVRACKYPPRGIRGYGPRRGQRYGAVSQQEYLATADQQTWVIVQIEHKDAVKNLDAILAVPGLDGICLGPNDLSGSMGKLGQADDPEVVQAIDCVIEKARRTDLFLGVSTGYSPDTLPIWIEKGIQWINLNVDWLNLFMQSKHVVDAVKQIGLRRRP